MGKDHHVLEARPCRHLLQAMQKERPAPNRTGRLKLSLPSCVPWKPASLSGLLARPLRFAGEVI